MITILYHLLSITIANIIINTIQLSLLTIHFIIIPV